VREQCRCLLSGLNPLTQASRFTSEKEKSHSFSLVTSGDRLADNLRALAMTLEAMRGLERWGCSEMLERVFNGFTALPAPESTSDQNLWWAVLNVSPFASLDQIEESYRKLAREYHPDTAENETVRKFRHKKMVELNQAITKARAEKRGAA
jgi:DnaJ-domain-containing protein 1